MSVTKGTLCDDAGGLVKLRCLGGMAVSAFLAGGCVGAGTAGMVPTAYGPCGVCCSGRRERAPLCLVPSLAADPRGGEQLRPTGMRRDGGTSSVPLHGVQHHSLPHGRWVPWLPSPPQPRPIAVGDAFLPDACSPGLPEQDLGFILEMEAIREHANRSGPPRHRIHPGGCQCLPPGVGASPLTSAQLRFPPCHVLPQLCEHPHHRAVTASAINPAQSPENIIFRLRLGPVCVSESVPEVVPCTCRARVVLQACSELRVLPSASLPRVAARAGPGCCF